MSCTQTSFNIRAVAGDIISRTLTFTNDDNTAYDLSIYNEIIMQVRQDTGTAVLSEISMTDGNFVVSGVGNNVLELSGLEVPLVAGKYKFDIEFSNVGIRETLVRGSFIVLSQITM